MQSLKERILRDGTVLNGNILKVDNFINHMIDPGLFMEMGKEYYDYFKDKNITKIFTIEVSGIGLAVTTGYVFQVPVLFAKKTISKTLSENCYETKVYSYTKKTTYTVRVDKRMLDSGDNVLIIDDFLANGEALKGLIDIVEQAGAKVAGIGIAIEKGFQKGGELIRSEGYDLKSLAIIKEFKDGSIIFDQNK